MFSYILYFSANCDREVVDGKLTGLPNEHNVKNTLILVLTFFAVNPFVRRERICRPSKDWNGLSVCFLSTTMGKYTRLAPSIG